MVVLPGSPSVVINEVNLTSSIPGVSSTTGAFVGAFRWGAANTIMQASSETDLKSVNLPPDNNTAVDFLSAANFLAYGNDLRYVRALGSKANNATATGTGIKIENEAVWDQLYSNGAVTTYGEYAARYAGADGNTIKVSTCPSAYAWAKILPGTANVTASSNSIAFSSNISGLIAVDDVLVLGNALGNVTVTALAANGFVLTVNTTIATTNTYVSANAAWAFQSYFAGPPGTSAYAASVNGANDEMHVIVWDYNGGFSSPPVGQGGANTALEIYPYVSKATDARNNDGTPNYVRDVIRNRSPFIYWMTGLTGGTNWGNTAIGTTFTTVSTNKYSLFAGGQTDIPVDADRQTAWMQFNDPEKIDVSLLIGGQTSTTLASFLISNIADVYKYAVLFLSPRLTDVVGVPGSEITNIQSFISSLTASDRTFIDNNWKYMLDRYNNVFRWIPCNSDTAGCAVRTDNLNDPWFSIAGTTRGGIKNVTKLAWSPTQAQRNVLYPLGVNSIINLAGQGPVLYGDKTFVTKPSAFDRINVRRLFIALEKSLAFAARAALFEFNDEFSRSAFVNRVTPFLTDVKGRRGITDFKVVCDASNNTNPVIQAHQFVGTVMVKPNYATNWTILNMVAVDNQATFETIPGQF